MLTLVGDTCSADVNVRVDTQSSSTERFLVTVHTRHADLHNGYSRVRFQGLVPANVRTKVAIDFHVSLIGHGVAAYHPDYHVESATTHSRWDELPALVARRWDAILQEAKSVPYYASGEGVGYSRVLHHVEAYGAHFLPALDQAGVDPDRAVVPRFAALLAKADALAVATTELERRGHARLKEHRARVLPELEKVLALTRAQRLAIVDFRTTTIGPKAMIAALQKDLGYRALLMFVAGAHAQHAGRPPQVHRWETGTGLRLTYRIVEWHASRPGDEQRDCARGQLVFDARPIAKESFQDLVKQVNNVDFCRDTAGRWSLESRAAYIPPVVDRGVEGAPIY
ncbi:MAG: hypothetical protein ACRELZ_08120 [Candidatus Rokuibacteriota bacterium]